MAAECEWAADAADSERLKGSLMFKFTSFLLSATGTLLLAASNPAVVPSGKAFPTPDAAAQALVNAAKANDVNAIIEILGPSSKDIVSTRDSVADQNIRKQFAARAAQKMRLVPSRGRQNGKELLVGYDGWPLPIPIVQIGGNWYFDMAAGRQEILNRRIGSNELDAIEICRGYVEAQQDYALAHHTDGGASYYAEKVISSPGQRDGLYWVGEPGADQSPIGKIIARAFAEGYHSRSDPYHGYYFRVLTAQGANVAGGEMSYLENGVMTKGFALIAWPANYGSTGIMTFVVNRNGIVHQKDLGRNTGQIASGYTAYDPDDSWTPVSDIVNQ
jgi:hypothetical protein